MVWITGQRFLSYEEALNNAEIVFSVAKNWGMTKEAICGLLGNMWRESHVNPSLGEEGGTGYGLTQWTPKSKLIARLAVLNLPDNGDNQLKVLERELSDGANNSGSPFSQWYDSGSYTLSAFKTTTDIDFAVEAFCWGYERPGVPAMEERKEYARKFFQDLTGTVPPDGGDGTQLAVLPIKMINVTQGENGSYSHMGTLCMDFVGTTPTYPYYAPCDCEMVMRQDSTAVAVWKSSRPVKRVDGSVGDIFWSAIHELPITHTVGTKLKKGELMGHTGVGGNVTGDHLHLQVMDGNNYQGFTTNAQGASTLIGTELHIYNVFSSCDNVTKEEFPIVNGGGYPWKCLIDWDDGGSTPPEPPTGSNNLITLLMVNALNGWYNY